jgi:hypothetical protein
LTREENEMVNITIKSIEAKLLDTSTLSKRDFMIMGWLVKYEKEIHNDLNLNHHIEGEIEWRKLPSIDEIMEFLIYHIE